MMADDSDNESHESFHTAAEALIPETCIVDVSHTANGTATAQSPLPLSTVKAVISRGYQIEMFEASLKENIIVAMDTGSGKTQIAVLRIQHEAEQGDPTKIIWFLAPTVALCAQQCFVIESQLPALQVRLFSGADNVDKWSEQRIWDSALQDVRIVVSTPAILLDVLTHGFVSLSMLSLLIFDEAHNCVGNNPGSRIMKDFYQRNVQLKISVPRILGLSASPVMNSNIRSLDMIEETLNSRCMTPTMHRDELLSYVNMPMLHKTGFTESFYPEELRYCTPLLWHLSEVIAKLDIEDDPYIRELRLEQTEEKNQRRLNKILSSQKTFCRQQLLSFYTTSLHICSELGRWAADHYVLETASRYLRNASVSNSHMGDPADKEKQYIAKILGPVVESSQNAAAAIKLEDENMVSDKVVQFISAIPRNTNLIGIVFVKQRATAAVLRNLLTIHPLTKSLSIATFMGSSNHRNRARELTTAIEPDDQVDTLDRFRSGQLELVIATSVLDEGIDVPACNFVLCFEMPANLRTFIQRRGRARQHQSQLVIMQSSRASNDTSWHELELQMKEMYAVKERRLKELEMLDYLEVPDVREFRIESTGALLHLENAVSHLNHFCAVLPAGLYVDLQPEYVFYESGFTEVILPLSVDASVRKISSLKSHRSEVHGKKDAAFQAFLALYQAGLVNDNLMPLMRHDTVEAISGDVEKRPILRTVKELHDPWISVAEAWVSQDIQTMTTRRIVVTDGHVTTSRQILMPYIPAIPCFTLYWNESTELTVNILHEEALFFQTADNLAKFRDTTQLLLESVFGHRFKIESSDLLVLFLTADGVQLLPMTERLLKVTNVQQLTEMRQYDLGLIRDTVKFPYFYQQWANSKPDPCTVKHLPADYDDLPNDTAFLVVKNLSKREDFLHPCQSVFPTQELEGSKKKIIRLLPASQCWIDTLPLPEIEFAHLIPSIIQIISVYLTVDTLCKTILSGVEFNDPSLVVTAITASSASSSNNYQRLEFLGDALLKICTSLQLLAEYPLYHEGYLSRAKDHIVNNARLSRAAIDTGLDEFVITKRFTARKWRPRYVSSVLQNRSEPPSERKLSSKILADVVESLIGAATISAGIPAALQCMSVFLPEVNWRPLEERRETVFERTAYHELPLQLQSLETLLDYKFSKPSLLIEAMTHASCNSGTGSYERLEYLGDAVLDYIVTRKVFSHHPALSHVQMHHLRSAFVNADFLAFICLDFSAVHESSRIVEKRIRFSKDTVFEPISEAVKLPLWKFMRHTSASLSIVQRTTAIRYGEVKDELLGVLHGGMEHPWALLARLQAQKFYSDVVEAILGAVYIDSGSFDVVTKVLETMGVLRYLSRALENPNINLWHPKEELGILANSSTVKYVVKNEKMILDGKDAWTWWCEVFVDDTFICRVQDGVSKEEVTTRGAQEAVKLMRAQKEGSMVALDNDMDCTASNVRIENEEIMVG